MKSANFHFDAILAALVQGAGRGADLEYRFAGPQTAKHLIEALGIPHTEVGNVLANGRAVDLHYVVQDGDSLEAVATSAANDEVVEPRFILDGHLGRLASRLRMLGLDCQYRNDYGDLELAELSARDERILLTRDRRLLMRKSILKGYLVRNLQPNEQLREVVQRFAAKKWIRPFQRCLRCNHLLEPIEKTQVIDRLQPLTRRYYNEFHACPACGQLYWKGSHFERMQELIADLLGSLID